MFSPPLRASTLLDTVHICFFILVPPLFVRLSLKHSDFSIKLIFFLWGTQSRRRYFIRRFFNEQMERTLLSYLCMNSLALLTHRLHNDYFLLVLFTFPLFPESSHVSASFGIVSETEAFVCRSSKRLKNQGRSFHVCLRCRVTGFYNYSRVFHQPPAKSFVHECRYLQARSCSA